MQNLTDPVFRNKMPLLDGTIASTGLSKPQNMSGLLGKQTLQYNGAYFAYDPRGKERARLTPPWSNSKTSLLDGRTPVSHLSGMDGQNHIIYRQDSNSSEEGQPHSSSLCRTQVKQGFTLYTKSPGVSSPTAATSVTVRKQQTGSANLSAPSENSVYLAIPKPIYGHNPCCNELGCVIGQRYNIDQGSPRIPNTVYEHDWMQTDAHYAERLPVQRKAQDTLLQQRGLQFEHSAETIKRMTMEAYSPSRARAFPAMIDPNYSSYPCTPTQTLFGSLSEQSQCLQTPPRGYSNLYPSHAIYENMTSELYQECSPVSKYGQLRQHPMFYYPQARIELQNRTQCKDISSKQREDVPVILKHTIANPQEHFMVPQSLHGEIPLPSTEMLPNHPLMRSFDYPCYAVPRFNLNANQIRHPLSTQHASPRFRSTHVSASPSSQHMDHPIVSAANLHKEKPNTALHLENNKAHTSLPFLCVDQTSPARLTTSQSGISPPRIQMNRFFPPLSSLHVDRPIHPPAGFNMDRLRDYNHCEATVTCLKQPKNVPFSPAKWRPRSPSHCSDTVQTVVPNGTNGRKVIYSPVVSGANENSGSVEDSGTTVGKGCLKRSVSHLSPNSQIKEEDEDLCYVELIKKRQKVELEKVPVETDSTPMPVIDNVFSLAPYQQYLQASGVLFPGRALCKQHKVKTNPDIKEKRLDQDTHQPANSPAPQKSSLDTQPEKTVVEIFEPKAVKVEKVDSSDIDDHVQTPVSQKDCSQISIKKEPEETSTSDSKPVLVVKKCESDEPEGTSLLVDETSDDSELTAQINSSSQADTNKMHGELILHKSLSSQIQPQPPESKVNFKNIPPQCLKLSAYKIILPDTKSFSPIPHPENPSLQQVTEFMPKVELQMPVRKHFLELHHSLCKLVSKSVSRSSEQELRTWLSHLKLTEPTLSATKVQKVSCLLGVKGREMWLSEEMKSALHQVLERLREYNIQDRCPFPHVMRTGAVFLPMLVVKELLFPTIQGSFIDQVLQEHKVELRPTTLSEEKILIQLHKRACSSRLRRLMSLKHLPDIYADVVNLFYYACVCKHLGECIFSSYVTEITYFILSEQ